MPHHTFKYKVIKKKELKRKKKQKKKQDKHPQDKKTKHQKKRTTILELTRYDTSSTHEGALETSARDQLPDKTAPVFFIIGV